MEDPQDLQADASPMESLPVQSDETIETTSPTMVVDNSSNSVMVPSPVVLHPMTKLQVSLLDTLSDLQIRTEVQDCMDGLLLDVEMTYYLRRELELQATKHALDMATKHHQATILEANAERQAREEEKLALADQLVQEFMALSREMEELLQWKRDNTHKVQEYETLLAKLMQTEEALQEAQSRASQLPIEQPSAPQTSVVPQLTSTPSSDQQQPPPQEKATSTETVTTVVITESQPPEVAPTVVTSPSQDESIAETASLQKDSMDDSKPAAIDSDISTTKTAAVTLDEDHPEDKANGLVDLDVEILMTIFGFLDAEDILNMAQINIAMYSKIDNIFGISEDGQTPPSAKPTAAPAAAARPPATTTSSTKPPPTTPTMVQVPPPAQSQAATTAPSGPIGNRLFSMLQPANKAGAKKSPSQGLNPTMAQSMASKLSDAEIAAILSMTDKLNRMDKQVTTLLAEKEALSAKLDGTEAVKQFLINKVRDVELKLTQSREDEIKVTQQIASDQEVIAFLDTRVQDLERITEALTKDKSRIQTDLDTLRVQSSKKITMLNDMLKYEREKLKDDEGEWKATKKVLIKEVKSCRAQILALQAERDGLKEQNEMLKRAIVSTAKSPSNAAARANSPLR